MNEKLREITVKLYENQAVRYIFFGVCTTMVNLISYGILRKMVHCNILPANIISITLSIIFAFFVNSRFVFHSQAKGWKENLGEFVSFFTARLGTMGIEAGGVVWLAWLGIPDMLSKIATQFLVLLLNYVFSKFLVFRKKREEKPQTYKEN